MRDKPLSDTDRAHQRGTHGTGPLDGLDDHGVSAARDLLPTENLQRGNPALSIRDGPQVQQDDPVLRPIDQGLDSTREADAIFSSERTGKDAILQRPAVGSSELMHLAEAPLVGDVIREQISSQHRYLVVNAG